MMENKLKLEDFCKPEYRKEKYCSCSFYLEINRVECPYYIKNENPIYSKCGYIDAWNKLVKD